jgi:hypothetical protein
MGDRHSERYYKDYYARPGKNKNKEKAAKQKEKRHREIEATRPRCNICGKPFMGRAIASPYTLIIGFHQTCNPAKYVAEYRKLKK